MFRLQSNDVLLIPDKPDVERDALAKAWTVHGGEVLRIGKFWIKPEVKGRRISLYGYDSFCLVLAQLLDLSPAMVNDAFVAELDYNFLKRAMKLTSLDQLEAEDFPTFIKPQVPKSFISQVYGSRESFSTTNPGIGVKEAVIVSEIVEVEKEVRAFVLNGVVLDLQYYEGTGGLDAPNQFLEAFLQRYSNQLPITLVVDLGWNPGKGWFVLEFNNTWGSGLNFCSPEKVIPAIWSAIQRKNQ
ncbi:MAG: ATP-grasp domain-containing protein [Bacteroidia bacterium]|nr:ATP-grasp domain-containing protein [Bacteroidia bacterium]